MFGFYTGNWKVLLVIFLTITNQGEKTVNYSERDKAITAVLKLFLILTVK